VGWVCSSGLFFEAVLRGGGFEPGRVVDFGLDLVDLACHGCKVRAGDRGGTAHGVEGIDSRGGGGIGMGGSDVAATASGNPAAEGRAQRGL